MFSKISEHGSSQNELSDNSIFDSFNLFLSLMTPVEFAKLLRSRVNHLLQTWPSPPASDSSQGQSDTSSSINLPYISMDSVLAFTSFFRTQDLPTTSELGAKLTPSSPDHIRQHLTALETLLSCLAPRELQELIKSRLKEGGKERTDAIRGLMDVMRRAASIDETPENITVEEKSSLHLNLGSNVEQTPIPRVMSPGTRDQSADGSNAQYDDSKKTDSQSSRNHEPRTGQNVPLMSPTLPTSKVSTSPITSPTRGNRRNVKLESSNKGKEPAPKPPGSRPAGSTIGPKSPASSPYSKVPQSTRRTRSSAALVPEPSTSRNQTNGRISEKPRRKSERLSKRNQPVTRSKRSKQSSKKELTMSPSPTSDTTKAVPPTSPATSSSRIELSPVGLSDQAASSFFPPSADGRTSPPGPVLRAVDWSTPVRSTPISSEEDREMEDEEEELDELADDSSEGLVSEIINGWNSHMVDAEPEIEPPPPSQVEPPTSTNRTSPIPVTPIVLKEEVISSEVVLTLSPEPSSPIPPLVSLRSSPSITEPIVVRQSVVDESSNITSIAIPEDHSMEVDVSPQIPPETPPPALSTPIPAQIISPPVYAPSYSNPHPPPGRNSYPQVGPPTIEAGQPHASQPPPHHHSPHMSNISAHPSYHPSSQPSSSHHHTNPYPPPPHPNHSYTHDYHPPPPPPHIPTYPPQHPTYTPPSWYGNSYYSPQPPPSYHQYPQQPNMPMPPIRDQHHHAPHLRPPHPPHSQSYPPPHYPQHPPPVPPPQFPPMRTPQNQFPPSQDNVQSQFPPPQPSVNHFHHPPPLPPSFPPSAPSYPHPSSSMQQQQGLIHSHYPPSQSTSVHLPHHFPSPHSHLVQPPPHSLHDNIPPDTLGSRPGLYTTNTMNNSASMTMSAPRPPSPIIPPPLGPRPPQPFNPLPSPQRRSPSPPVKPPEGPKRFFQKRRSDEEGGDVNSPGAGGGAGDQDDPNVRYTSEVGIKETLSVRRRCHNCRTVEAPSWRKSKLSIGKILCNKCGIYESTHLMARPLKTRPRRLMLSGEQRDPYQFEIYTASPVTSFGSPTFRRRRSPSDNDDDFDFDE